MVVQPTVVMTIEYPGLTEFIIILKPLRWIFTFLFTRQRDGNTVFRYRVLANKVKILHKYDNHNIGLCIQSIHVVFFIFRPKSNFLTRHNFIV